MISETLLANSAISLEELILGGFLITVILLTVLYYFRAIKVLRQYPIEFQQAVRPAIRKLHLYAFVQFITLVPNLLRRIIQIQEGTGDSKDINAFSILANLSGLANALIYLLSSQNYIELDDRNSMERSIRHDE